MTSSAGSAGGGNTPPQRFNKMVTEEDRRRVLSERAKLLAVKTEEKVVHAGELLHVFEYLLAGETYAFDTKYVREVLAAKNVATVPCTPRFISGVLNVRGEIITVLDTKLLLGLTSQGIATTSKIIIVSDGAAQMGFLVDGVVGISELSKRELQAPLNTISQEQAKYIAGMTSAPLILIDLQALMNDPSVFVDEEVD